MLHLYSSTTAFPPLISITVPVCYTVHRTQINRFTCSTHQLPDVGVRVGAARLVVCTTNGNGGSRMSWRWDADEPAAEAETPPVGGFFEPGAPPAVDSMFGGVGSSRTRPLGYAGAPGAHGAGAGVAPAGQGG